VLLKAAPTSGSQISGKFHVFAELFGTSDGEKVPICYIAGMSDNNNNSLPLLINGDWITRANAVGPYELRNVRVACPNTWAIHAESSVVALSYPPNAFLDDPQRRPPISNNITYDMKNGRPLRNNTNGGSGRRLLQSGNVLMLVNDYCACSNPWPTSDFTNYAVFSELYQSLSNDQYAQAINSFGSSYSSFGVLGLGQGGNAALQLYTFYTSGLDYATGRRLIQSVGAPYQGTNAAGNTAYIQQVFGSECTVVYNLTPTGAAAWLSNIPSNKRTSVYYYTVTPPSGNVCTSLSSGILTEPSDGFIQQSPDGQLSRGNNLGNTGGWCHMANMNYAAAYLDHTQNSNMNSLAAR